MKVVSIYTDVPFEYDIPKEICKKFQTAKNLKFLLYTIALMMVVGLFCFLGLSIQVSSYFLWGCAGSLIIVILCCTMANDIDSEEVIWKHVLVSNDYINFLARYKAYVQDTRFGAIESYNIKKGLNEQIRQQGKASYEMEESIEQTRLHIKEFDEYLDYIGRLQRHIERYESGNKGIKQWEMREMLSCHRYFVSLKEE